MTDEAEVSEVRQALYRGDRAAAETLAAQGVELNVFDAAALGDEERLRELLVDDPALVLAWSADGFTALHFAAYLGGAGPVRILLEAGSDVHAPAHNDMHVQPLHSGAALGDVDACRLLLEAGADANATQQGGYTPLDEALITRNKPLAALLREHGARPSGNSLPDGPGRRFRLGSHPTPGTTLIAYVQYPSYQGRRCSPLSPGAR